MMIGRPVVAAALVAVALVVFALVALEATPAGAEKVDAETRTALASVVEDLEKQVNGIRVLRAKAAADAENAAKNRSLVQRLLAWPPVVAMLSWYDTALQAFYADMRFWFGGMCIVSAALFSAAFVIHGCFDDDDAFTAKEADHLGRQPRAGDLTFVDVAARVESVILDGRTGGRSARVANYIFQSQTERIYAFCRSVIFALVVFASVVAGLLVPQLDALSRHKSATVRALQERSKPPEPETAHAASVASGRTIDAFAQLLDVAALACVVVPCLVMALLLLRFIPIAPERSARARADHIDDVEATTVRFMSEPRDF
jgi:hypothetical protein